MEVQRFDIEGPMVIRGTRFHDERGYFSETYNEKAFADLGLPTFVQDNLSLSEKGVFRGLHWQVNPAAQGKLVTCLAGEIEDYVVDIRCGSPTFGAFLCVLLGETKLESLWVPPGFAHGFFSMRSKTIVSYKVTAFWNKEAERSLNFRTVLSESRGPSLISDKDLIAPTLSEIQRSDLFN